jgi:peroxiredoxin
MVQLAVAMLVLGVFAATFLWAGGWRLGGKTPNLAVGQPAPDFELPDLAGEQVSLSRFRGQYVLLGFWASWCPSCREEMPSLEQFYREFGGPDLVLLNVNIGESREKVAAFAGKRDLTFPLLLDTREKVRKLYGANLIPMFYLIDREGRIAARYLGLQDWSSDEVRQEITSRMGR